MPKCAYPSAKMTGKNCDGKLVLLVGLCGETKRGKTISKMDNHVATFFSCPLYAVPERPPGFHAFQWKEWIASNEQDRMLQHEDWSARV